MTSRSSRDETELEFAQHKLVLHEVVEGARKEFEGLRQAIHGLHVEIANMVTNLQQRVVHLESNTSGAYHNKGYLLQKSIIPKNFTDKADEWRSWQKDISDYVDTVTPEMKKVLAEIDQETDVIDELWRHARETKYGKVMEEHISLWRLLRRITDGESKKVVMSVKDEDGFRAWQRLKQ